VILQTVTVEVQDSFSSLLSDVGKEPLRDSNTQPIVLDHPPVQVTAVKSTVSRNVAPALDRLHAVASDTYSQCVVRFPMIQVNISSGDCFCHETSSNCEST